MTSPSNPLTPAEIEELEPRRAMVTFRNHTERKE